MTRLAWTVTACLGLVLGASWLSAPANAERRKSAARSHDSITEGLDCATCHSPAGWKQLSDTPGEGGFDHSRTGFPLTGRHRNEGCTSCHHADQAISRECSSCHEDSHQQKLGQDCASCHSSQSWQAVRAIERHRRTRLPLTGMHALADCSECHQRSTDARWSGVPADCIACHEAEYRRPDLHPIHTGRAGKTPTAPFSRNCGDCHRATGWSPAFVIAEGFRASVTPNALTLARAPAQHELVFPIARGSHRGATCDDCHSSETIPRATRCTGCHAHSPVRLRELHRGTTAALGDGGCLGCHPGGAVR